MGNKAIFIGLGGAGVTTAVHLKAKLWQSAGSLNKLAEDCRFIFVDTADDNINRLNDQYRRQLGGEKIIAESERVDLGPVNPHAQYVYARKAAEAGTADRAQQQLLSFVDPKGTVEFKSAPMRDGASGNRQQGRVGVWRMVGDLQSKISQAVRLLQTISNEELRKDPIPCYILSGTCGGTGSSALLDVAYIVDREIKRQFPEAGDPKLRAVLFMPHPFVQIYRSKQSKRAVIENYESNSFAFFDEIDFFLKDFYSDRAREDAGEKFAPVSVEPQIDRGLQAANRKWPVFNFAVCIDSTTEQGATLTLDQMYRNTAEMLYYWHQGNTQGTMVAELDNELFKVYTNTPSGRPIPAIVTMGYRALQFPEELLRDYMKKRFLYEFFDEGLLGKKYADAFPDQTKRREELKAHFQQSVERYLLAEKAEAEVPNLEENRNEVIDGYLRSLTANRFKEDSPGLIGRITGTLTRSSEPEYDADRIGDAIELQRLIDYADTVRNEISKEIEDRFRSAESETGRERLLSSIRFGAQAAEGAPRPGSLERQLEDSILRFGVRYAGELARRLDNLADTLAQQLNGVKMEQEARLRRLEADIEAARAKCLSGNDKEKRESFNALFSKLQERVRVSSHLVIVSQQTGLLHDLSAGESGVLDEYRRNLEEMEIVVNERLLGSKDVPDAPPGIADNYKVELPRRFLETAADVTTTHLPDVKSFAPDMMWHSDHLFAKLYATLVKQINRPGGEEPVRYGDDFGRHSEVAGLHRIMRDMLTSNDITGYARGYEQNGEIAFFRRYFTLERREPVDQMANLCEEYAGHYIAQQMGRSDEIKEEINLPLSQRLRGGSMDIAAQQRIKDLFSDAGTQTFCQMRGSESPSTNSLYVGNDEELAQFLGYEKNNAQQFILGPSPNRFLRIKAQTLHTIDRYPHHERYLQIYQTAKEERARSGQVFASHIHRLFNEHGVSEGMRLLVQPTSGELLNLFALIVLYREMFISAKDSKPELLAEIFHLDPVYTGDRATCHSPLLLEEPDYSQDYMALICSTVKRRDDKLLLERGAFINVAGSVRNYKQIYDGLAGRPQLVGALQTVDEFFRAHCSRSWLGVFDEADKKLQEKIRGADTSTEAESDFHDELMNAYADVSRSMRNYIANRQEEIRPRSPTPQPQSRPNM